MMARASTTGFETMGAAKCIRHRWRSTSMQTKARQCHRRQSIVVSNRRASSRGDKRKTPPHKVVGSAHRRSRRESKVVCVRSFGRHLLFGAGELAPAAACSGSGQLPGFEMQESRCSTAPHAAEAIDAEIVGRPTVFGGCRQS